MKRTVLGLLSLLFVVAACSYSPPLPIVTLDKLMQHRARVDSVTGVTGIVSVALENTSRREICLSVDGRLSVIVDGTTLPTRPEYLPKSRGGEVASPEMSVNIFRIPPKSTRTLAKRINISEKFPSDRAPTPESISDLFHAPYELGIYAIVMNCRKLATDQTEVFWFTGEYLPWPDAFTGMVQILYRSVD